MATSTLTSKGQITIPKEICEHFKLRAATVSNSRLPRTGSSLCGRETAMSGN